MAEYTNVNQNISDDAELRELGVQPVFKRVLGLFSVSFLAIACQGPTAAIFTVGIAMIAFLGPSLIWTVPVVLLFQLIIALIWMELSSYYPLAGGIYQWARYLGGEMVGFFAWPDVPDRPADSHERTRVWHDGDFRRAISVDSG